MRKFKLNYYKSASTACRLINLPAVAVTVKTFSIYFEKTAIFTKHQPVSVTYGIGIDLHDHEGRVITLEMKDFFLVCCYTPNSQDGLKRLEYRMSWEDAFRSYLKRLDQQKPVILCGDLNVAHEER